MTVLIFDTEQTDRKEGEIIEAAWLRLAPQPDLFGGSDHIAPDLALEQLFQLDQLTGNCQ